MAVDTLGHLLALHVTPADRDGRAEIGPLTEAIQQATDGSVELAWADQGYTGSKAAKAAEEQDITLEIVMLLRQSGVLCCCPGDGSWKDRSHGLRVAEGS